MKGLAPSSLYGVNPFHRLVDRATPVVFGELLTIRPLKAIVVTPLVALKLHQEQQAAASMRQV
jgi:hypothetical protein